MRKPKEIKRLYKTYYRQWHSLFKCSCGKVFKALRCNVQAGHQQGCGCRWKIHGHRQNGESPTHISWRSMRERVLNKNHMHYKRYGGKGIKICKRWNQFVNFLNDMGTRPKGKTLDRLNPFKDYKRSNCRWATWKQQNNHLGRVYAPSM